MSRFYLEFRLQFSMHKKGQLIGVLTRAVTGPTTRSTARRLDSDKLHVAIRA